MSDIMRKHDIPGHIINIIKQTYEGQSERRLINQGVHQGCSLPRLLFIIYINSCHRKGKFCHVK
jgi:hypothetical protein